jgi:uncharacterized membrane protein
VEELESWVKTYAYIQSLSDIAQAHYHFEMKDFYFTDFF